MNPLHLFWIIPISTIFGFGVCAVLIAAKEADEEL